MDDTLRVLVFNTEGAWIAQCLEHDICVQADNLNALQRRFEDAMFCESDHLEDIGPAPDFFQKKWDSARELSGAPDKTEMRLAA